MSASDIPYQLRPNKFIDREVFMDLLGRLVPTIGADRYVYVSMGGRHMVDHGAVYRQVGITNLYTFDFDEQVVARQMFNRPIDKAVCVELDSSSLPGKLDTIASQFPGATNVVVWLDYTSPRERLRQFQELVEVAKRLTPGDILRITVNANMGSFGEDRNPSIWKDEGYKNPGEFRAARLKSQLGTFVPTTLESIGENEIQFVISECIGLALAGVGGAVVFTPLPLTSYRDGQRMVSATCLVRDAASETEVPGLKGWPFDPTGWRDVADIDAPYLSLREKLKIDECLSKAPEVVLKQLGFPLMKDEKSSLVAIASYQRLHRYYPAFHHVES